MADKLIKIAEGQYVMASQVINVEVGCHGDVFISTTKGKYTLELGYNERSYQGLARIVDEINKALSDE
ncbi:hypothetical protein [Serratia sp. 14-2641]|uniref:hypothetical protein n=1 Tax=Serratia sp. 14-2641 TaxID=1841657 RepID=UPI00080FFF76|nr:hypothetical protein [Serratia sp. 14-2641]OCJ24594.1 hypothetical protein A6U95_10800 [Serratia sp. 14-2641]